MPYLRALLYDYQACACKINHNVQDINYRSLQTKTADISKDPWIAMGLGLGAIVFIVGIVLLFSEYLAVVENIVILGGFLLLSILFVLIYYIIYDVQLKRNKLLRAFARDNNFTFTSFPPIFGRDYVPAYVSSSLLLSGVRRIGYAVWPRSNMSLRGTYDGLNFTITIVGMHWAANRNKSGVSFFQTVVLHSDALSDSPHLIALSKISDRLTSSLNIEVVDAPAWQSVVLGWEASARYDIYTDDAQNVMELPNLSRAMARVHVIDGSDIEIVDSDIYLIKIDGIDFSEEGFRPIFEKISAIAAEGL